MIITPLDEIASFLRVVEAGSFAAASRRHAVPKSTLSRAVTRLEDAHRVRLIQRSTKQIALTEAGRAFHAQIAPHVTALEDAAAHLGRLDEQPRGVLRVSAPAGIGEGLLGEWLVAFAARYPELRVDLDLSGRITDFARDGHDVAVRIGSLKDSALVARKVGALELRLYAAPAYVARKQAPRTLGELEHHDYVAFRPPGRETAWPLPGHAKLVGRIVANDFHVLRSIIVAGGGVGILPVFVAAREVEAGRLVNVVTEWANPGGTVYVVYPQARHVPRNVIVFRDFVLECFLRSGSRRL